jgi:hypothetical protein
VPFACDKSSIEPEVESVKLNSKARTEESEKTLTEQIAENDYLLEAFLIMEANSIKITSYFINLSKEQKELFRNRLKIKHEDKKINLTKLNIGLSQEDLLLQNKAIAKFVKYVHQNFKELKKLNIEKQRRILREAYSIIRSKSREGKSNKRVEEFPLCDFLFGYCMADAYLWYVDESIWCHLFYTEPYECLYEATMGYTEALAECVGDYMSCTDNPGGN